MKTLLAVAAVLLIPTASASAFTAFTSPSGNIGCYVDSGTVRCDIRAKDWPTPKRPKSCELDYGQGVTLGKTGRARYICAGDTALGNGRPLAYGKTLRSGKLLCKSLTSGMRCTNTSTHHGFVLSRELVDLF